MITLTVDVRSAVIMETALRYELRQTLADIAAATVVCDDDARSDFEERAAVLRRLLADIDTALDSRA
jgi:hypothetical protein